MSWQTMKPLHTHATHGRVLRQVCLTEQRWKVLPSQTKVPPSNKLFNFDVQAGRGKTARTFLVLDPYGNETLPERMVNRFFGHADGVNFTLAIDRQTGQLFQAGFFTEKVKGKTITGLSLSELTANNRNAEEASVFLPKPYLKRLDELKSKKRPFRFTCSEYSIWGFIEQEAHLDDLRRNLIVEFEFNGDVFLQLWGEDYREVSRWR